eukprot:7235948-Alexandrium_andersonii.AAC.1
MCIRDRAQCVCGPGPAQRGRQQGSDSNSGLYDRFVEDELSGQPMGSPTQRCVAQPWRGGDLRAAGVMPPGAPRR